MDIPAGGAEIGVVTVAGIGARIIEAMDGEIRAGDWWPSCGRTDAPGA